MSQKLAEAIATANPRLAEKVGYQREQLNPTTGRAIKPNKKTHCTYWIRHGTCGFSSARYPCRFLHEMPDEEQLKNFGLTGTPQWWKDRQGDHSKTLENPRRIPDRTAQSSVDGINKTSQVAKTDSSTPKSYGLDSSRWAAQMPQAHKFDGQHVSRLEKTSSGNQTAAIQPARTVSVEKSSIARPKLCHISPKGPEAPPNQAPEQFQSTERLKTQDTLRMPATELKSTEPPGKRDSSPKKPTSLGADLNRKSTEIPFSVSSRIKRPPPPLKMIGTSSMMATVDPV
jgi:hypothetical protein